MANSIYDVARFRFAKALIDWSTAPLFVLAYSGTPVFHPEDDLVADITARAVTLLVKQSQAVVGKAVHAQGYLQTGNVLFEDVAIGPPITHFVTVLQTGTLENAIPLLFTDEAYNLPFTPNGLDVIVTPDWMMQRGWGRL